MPDYFTKKKIILWSQIFAKKFAARYQLILKILQIFIFPFNGNESAKVSAVTTNVVDTTGAGDSFAAGFIPKWLETSDLTQALTAGAALAAKCVSSVGARPPLN